MPSRKYLLKGLNDSDVQAYLEYQVSLAELLGADRDSARNQLTDSLRFEMAIANVSQIPLQWLTLWCMSSLSVFEI